MKKINSWQWYDYPEVGSTNDAIRNFTRQQDGKFIVSARRQTAGRGRRGRRWIADEGNLMVSLALEIKLDKLTEMIFITSLALLETVKSFNNMADVKLKWPNDVLLNGGKLCGILLEKGEGGYLIIGIGVNIISAPPASGSLYPAVSLAAAGIQTTREEFLQRFIGCFDNRLALWQSQGNAPLREAWLQNVKGLGEKIVVNMENGSKNGTFLGVDEAGALLLGGENGIEKIYAGDIFYPQIMTKGK